MSEKNKPVCIVVLGMHRSGTSLITKGLDSLGVYLGDKFVPTEIDNPKGYWENEKIVELNNSILSFFCLNLYGTKHISESEISTIPVDYYREAISIINSLKTRNLFGFKDPRTTRLILFWKKILLHCEIEAKYVIAIRNPISVSSSLKKRDNLHPTHSQLLWLLHVLPPLYHVIDEKKIIIDYDCFLENPNFFLKKISEKLLSQNINDQQIYQYINSFIDPSLKHNSNTYEVLETSDDLLLLTIKTYKILRQASLTENDCNQDMFKALVVNLNNELASLALIFDLVNFQINKYENICWELYDTKTKLSSMIIHPLIKFILVFGELPGLKKLKRQILDVYKKTTI
ncbi:sulfotransferase family protein [Methylicorpusculum sp.]|uniref:sulfotransferase family protein n=1 Tax=Methylicorpusculum sp. TaxID=2713644 RepID=UPI0027305821|nr:hypothetical protein [Methylicorpusculum sp.]MDP2178136.1 hypothetical protein [Methylicorpusculum sp.]MDP3531052.1 hypothetical protein [Methylicorpusculum sp.]